MPNHDAIERRAYELYEERGREAGHEWDDWLQAEREVAESEIQSARAATTSDASPRRRRTEQSTALAVV